MGTPSFHASFLTDRSPGEVFDAINDVGSWWSGSIQGRTAGRGAEFTYRYGDLHVSTQRVTESARGRKVVWRVTDSHLGFVETPDEWTGTEIVFEIDGRNGQTELRFTHAGLVPDSECYGSCSTAWTAIIDNLHRRIATGEAQPDPFATGTR